MDDKSAACTADDILRILSKPSTGEVPEIANLRTKAYDLISGSSPSSSELPNTLLSLLEQILKALFTTTQHPSLTSTGRRNLLPHQPTESRLFRDFSALALDNSPPWLTPWTIPLLSYILSSYHDIPLESRKPAIESHFHLLIPPILNILDSPNSRHKITGMDAVASLCGILLSVESDILRRTGLNFVFVDALKSNFTSLPALTPEENSLRVMRALYPAWFALADARFLAIREETALFSTAPPPKNKSDRATPGTSLIQDLSEPEPEPGPEPEPEHQTPRANLPAPSAEYLLRNGQLTHLLRHSLLYALVHLNQSESLTTTTSLPLTLFFLSQLPRLMERMGIYFVKHLQDVLPMLCGALRDPFVLAGPALAGAILDVLQAVVAAYPVRIRERWWGEVLRGCVACWGKARDERAALEEGTHRDKLDGELRGLQARLSKVVETLGLVMVSEWEEIETKLTDEDGELGGLFGHV